ncbi:MAG: hypothetical protein RIC18_06875 [Hoeflea sp.]|uniref:tetratricopeptide repeat protein n=1 Tax=Hoeflea sp. TaxID=1940281 RepID=UPI0032EF1F91
MSVTMARPVAQRHPWLDVFVANPAKGFSDLLAGYAPVFPYTRADAPDAARMLFGPLPGDDPAWPALSIGTMEWLNSARRRPLPADVAARQNLIREVSEAFEIISLLQVAEAAATLRREYVRWANWTAQLVMESARDAHAAYLRMLSQTQGAVVGVVASPDALQPLWMRLCREAGGELEQRYLQIGLLGLRQLPGSIQRGDTPWIAGLAAWALERRPPDKQFLRFWRPLKRLYPAPPATLRKQVFNVLAQKPFKDAEIEFPAWWTADPDFAKAQSKPGVVALEPPSPEVVMKLVQDIRENRPYAELQPRIAALAGRFRIYTQRSGDDYNLVRSFCNIGMALIRNNEEARVQRARYAQSLAREALNHQPNNLFAWSLWRDALAAEGALQAARALGWEMVRRFPEDPQPRTLLGDLLSKEIGELEEAISLGRETVRVFPEDAHARNQLAEVLIADEREAEAREVISAAMADGVADVATFAMLARLSAHEGDFDGAQRAVAQGLLIDPYNKILLNQQSSLEHGKAPPLVSAAYRARKASGDVGATDSTLEGVLRDGALRALRSRLDDDENARAELKRVLTEDPTFAYAQLLAARHKLWSAESDMLPTVAAAFEGALADKDLSRLAALAERAPKLEALILLARALFGDVDAAREIAARLARGDDAPDDRGLQILRARLRPMLTAIDGGKTAVDAIQDNADRVRQALYDANEAQSAPELMAA